MSGAQSISARRAYGVQRVCRVWGRARSSVYVRRHGTRSRASRRRGPVGAATDEVLVGHIRRVLEASPFHGEGVPESGLCCVLCAKALEQKERSWHKVACRSRPTHKGVTP